MEYNKHENQGRTESVFSKKIRAGKRRTYFFDVRPTRSNDYFITITESKKRNDDSYERYKIFLYKEDINKFMETLSETVAHIKTELMPGYDFDEFNRRDERKDFNQQPPQATQPGNSESAPGNEPPSAMDDEDLKM